MAEMDGPAAMLQHGGGSESSDSGATAGDSNAMLLDNLRQLEQDLEAKATENREMAAIQNELLTSIRSKSTELDSARDTARQLQVRLAACVFFRVLLSFLGHSYT